MINQLGQTAAPDRAWRDLRPFYFIVVFWGERFRQYLVEYCLPSLLAPNNLPVLSGGRNKFIFCTTPQDWAELRATKIFMRLQTHVEPYLIEIPPAPLDKSGCEHMGGGHKLAAEMAYRDKAYAVFITPDLIISDGTVSGLCKHAAVGAKVVLTAALRFAEEPLFENLTLLGLRDADGLTAAGEPLSMTGRQMVAVGLRSFHSQSKRYEWEASYFTNFPSACWWRVPGEEGIVLHSLSWAPLLCDYAAVENHDTSVFDTWTLDGDYIYKNFGDDQGFHVVTDSDEMMLLSWAPLADRPQSLAFSLMKGLPFVGNLIKGGILRAVLLSGVFDSLKHRIFFKTVRWHSRELTETWKETEGKAIETLRLYLPDIECPQTALRGRSSGIIFLGAIATVGRVWIAISHLYQHRDRVRMRFALALRGDRDARARISRRIRLIWRLLRGSPTGNL